LKTHHLSGQLAGLHACAKAYATRLLPFETEPVENEPTTLPPVGYVSTGKVIDGSGQDYQFTTDRINNGFY